MLQPMVSLIKPPQPDNPHLVTWVTFLAYPAPVTKYNENTVSKMINALKQDEVFQALSFSELKERAEGVLKSKR